MVKHTQTIPTNFLSVFDHFVELPLKGEKGLASQKEEILEKVYFYEGKAKKSRNRVKKSKTKKLNRNNL